MPDYVPTTDDVRLEYMAVRWGKNDIVSFEARAEFDRWLAKRDAEVAAKAWDEAIRYIAPDDVEIMWAANPYRKAVQDD